jgi:hypothetical protein
MTSPGICPVSYTLDLITTKQALRRIRRFTGYALT